LNHRQAESSGLLFRFHQTDPRKPPTRTPPLSPAQTQSIMEAAKTGLPQSNPSSGQPLSLTGDDNRPDGQDATSWQPRPAKKKAWLKRPPRAESAQAPPAASSTDARTWNHTDFDRL